MLDNQTPLLYESPAATGPQNIDDVKRSSRPCQSLVLSRTRAHVRSPFCLLLVVSAESEQHSRVGASLQRPLQVQPKDVVLRTRLTPRQIRKIVRGGLAQHNGRPQLHARPGARYVAIPNSSAEEDEEGIAHRRNAVAPSLCWERFRAARAHPSLPLPLPLVPVLPLNSIRCHLPRTSCIPPHLSAARRLSDSRALVPQHTPLEAHHRLDLAGAVRLVRGEGVVRQGEETTLPP